MKKFDGYISQITAMSFSEPEEQKAANLCNRRA